MVPFILFYILHEYRIQNNLQFVKAGCRRHLSGFYFCNRSGIKHFNNAVDMGYHEDSRRELASSSGDCAQVLPLRYDCNGSSWGIS